MNAKVLINVILPLRLEWEPYYYAEKGIEVGMRVNVSFGRKNYLGVVSSIRSAEQQSANLKKILTINSISDLPKISEKELQFWRFISSYYLCTVGEVYKTAYPNFRTASEKSDLTRHIREEKQIAKKKEKLELKILKLSNRLSKLEEQLSKARLDSTKEKYQDSITEVKHAVFLSEKELASLSKESHRTQDFIKQPKEIQLTDGQNKAYTNIHKAFADRKTVLLKGVTGAGKTEIFAKLATETLLEGKNVLYLIPGIALGRQLEERLHSYLGDYLLVSHSGDTAAKRQEVVREIRARDNYAILGTRSSIFLPIGNLGLIIVDEEQESSYKQSSPAPRYNGRDAATALGLIHGAKVILGSATPSLESIYNCSVGRWTLVSLNQRYYQTEDADIEIIDTIAERKKNGMVGNFSRRLIKKINEALANNGQVLIFRGRRAWSTILQCSDCGAIVKCPHCNVNLSYHKDTQRHVCHYCGHSEPFTDKCGSCGGKLVTFGAGTQKIEEEAVALFPNAKVARIDGDTAKSRSEEVKTLKEFENGEIDILVGTQVVSKGFDFEKLGLVAIIQSDSLLGISDYRADEKAAGLIDQLRGRSGRRGKKGELVIQTSNPDHPIYQRFGSGALQNEFEAKLLNERYSFDYPPYTRIIQINVHDSSSARLEQMSGLLAQRLKGTTFIGKVSIVGPYSPTVDKTFDEFHKSIRISLSKDSNISTNKARIKNAVDVFISDHKYYDHINIDVDPA